MATYALKKYSIATTTEKSFTKNNFTHISGEQLYLLTDRLSPERLSCTQRTMPLARFHDCRVKSLTLTSIQVNIPVGQLTRASLCEKAQSQAHTYNREQLSIFAITKTSQLALQYRLPDKPSEKHRIQVTFQSETDATTIAQHLQATGMEVDDMNVPPRLQQSVGGCEMISAAPSTVVAPPAITPGIHPRHTQGPLDGRQSYTATTSPTLNDLAQGGSVPEHPTSGNLVQPSSALHNLIPPPRGLPVDFPPNPVPPEASPSNTSSRGRGRGRGRMVTRSSTRITRNRSGARQRAAPARQESAVVSAPAAIVQSRPPTLTERTTLMPPPPSSDRFLHTSNFQTDKFNIRPDAEVPVSRTSAVLPVSDTDDFSRSLTEITGNAGNTGPDRDQLARYAAQPDDERRQAIDSFIIDNLHNEDFHKLCHDLNRCWRRQALGL